MRLSTVSLAPTTLKPSNLLPGVYTCYKWLIIGLLFVAELHVEYSPNLFRFGLALPLLNKWRAFAGVHGISATPCVSTTGILKGLPLLQVLSLGDMTLPNCNTGLGMTASIPSASVWLVGVRVRVALGHACSPYRCCFLTKAW
jgi:hypothetical protein